MSRRKPVVAVLVSGEGTNLQALIDAVATGSIGATLGCVLSDRVAARGLERARAAGIPARHVRVAPTRIAGYDDGMRAALRECAPDLVVLAGYMRLLSAALVGEHRGRMINLHPSLLPAYPGLDTHRRVLEAGDAYHGATVHFVTADLDAGPAIAQFRLAVRPGDTETKLSARVHAGEHILLPRVVAWFCEGRLRLEDDTVILDGQRLRKPIVIEEDA